MKNNQKGNYYRFARKDVAGFLPQSFSRVLEIGCAEGRFIENLPDAQEYWGVEPNESAAAKAVDRLHKVVVGEYGDVAGSLPNSFFDLVICNDSIEHMRDHDEFLRSVKQKMAPGGHLVGSVPNVRYVTNLFDLLVRRDWPYVDSGVLDRTHLRFFTTKSLKRAFIEHGYIVEDIRGINSIIRRPRSIKAMVQMFLTLFSIGISMGFNRDIQYLQIGFRVRCGQVPEGCKA